MSNDPNARITIAKVAAAELAIIQDLADQGLADEKTLKILEAHKKLRGRVIDELEAAVIEAAQEWGSAKEGSNTDQCNIRSTRLRSP